MLGQQIWKMNMHMELYDMMSIVDVSRKCSNITNTGKASEDDQKKFCLFRSGITPGHRRWSWVLIINRLRICYWLTVMPRRFETSWSVSMNKAVLNDWACWWRISSSSSSIHKWTLLLMLLDLRCNSQNTELRRRGSQKLPIELQHGRSGQD